MRRHFRIVEILFGASCCDEKKQARLCEHHNEANLKTDSFLRARRFYDHDDELNRIVQQ